MSYNAIMNMQNGGGQPPPPPNNPVLFEQTYNPDNFWGDYEETGNDNYYDESYGYDSYGNAYETHTAMRMGIMHMVVIHMDMILMVIHMGIRMVMIHTAMHMEIHMEINMAVTMDFPTVKIALLAIILK